MSLCVSACRVCFIYAAIIQRNKPNIRSHESSRFTITVNYSPFSFFWFLTNIISFQIKINVIFSNMCVKIKTVFFLPKKHIFFLLQPNVSRGNSQFRDKNRNVLATWRDLPHYLRQEQPITTCSADSVIFFFLLVYFEKKKSSWVLVRLFFWPQLRILWISSMVVAWRQKKLYSRRIILKEIFLRASYFKLSYFLFSKNKYT